MRTLMIAFLAASFCTPAFAKGKKGGGGGHEDDGKIRLKLTTPIYSMATYTTDYDGTSTEMKMSGISLGNGGSRLEGGYLINKNIEVGTFLGFSSISTTVEGDDAGKTGELAFMPYLAYNKKLSDMASFYGQVFVGIDNQTAETITTTVDTTTGETSTATVDAATKWTGGGVDLGVRLKFNKYSSLDFAAQYMMANGKYEVDGESDDKLKLKLSDISLLMGIGIRI